MNKSLDKFGKFKAVFIANIRYLLGNNYCLFRNLQVWRDINGVMLRIKDEVSRLIYRELVRRSLLISVKLDGSFISVLCLF